MQIEPRKQERRRGDGLSAGSRGAEKLTAVRSRDGLTAGSGGGEKLTAVREHAAASCSGVHAQHASVSNELPRASRPFARAGGRNRSADLAGHLRMSAMSPDPQTGARITPIEHALHTVDYQLMQSCFRMPPRPSCACPDHRRGPPRAFNSRGRHRCARGGCRRPSVASQAHGALQTAYRRAGAGPDSRSAVLRRLSTSNLKGQSHKDRTASRCQ